MFEKVKSIRMAFCLLAISFLVLCGFVTSRDEKYVSYFLHLYSAGLFRERNFTLHKATATFGKDHINRVEMSFSCYKALPLENARKLVTSVALDLLQKINSDPGLKEKGLVKEKFIPRQLHLRIICDNAIGENYQNNFIREIILDRGQLTYHTFKNMPEMWGKSYTIHEDFDYALMLVGSARPSEEVIAETRIVPQMRAMPGDTSDFPSRQHEELLAPTPVIVKEQLEPKESAPSPVVPLKVTVEELYQLNMPPRKLPVIEEDVTPKAVDNAPPMPAVLTPAVQPNQVPEVPSTLLAPEVLPPVPVIPATEDKQLLPLLPQPVEKSAMPPQEAGVEAPEAPRSTSQMPERLKQAEIEGQKLLSRHDTDTRDDPVDSTGNNIPTLPETHIAESPKNDDLDDSVGKQPTDNQIDLFGLFDSFTSSFTAKPPQDVAFDTVNEENATSEIALEQSAAATPAAPNAAQKVDEDAATKEADAIFEQYERENNLSPSTPPQQPNGTSAPSTDAWQPPQAALQSQGTDALIADNDSAEDSEPEANQAPDDSMPRDQDLEMDEYEYNLPPEGSSDNMVEQVAVVEEEQTQAPKSWWQSLFSSKAVVADAEVQNDELQKDAPELPLQSPVDGSEELALADVEPETTEEVTVVEEEQTQAPKSWWQGLFSTKAAVADAEVQNDEVQNNQPSPPSEPDVDASEELVLADFDSETTEEVAVVEEEQAQAPKSWWQSLFSNKVALANNEAQVDETQNAPQPDDEPGQPLDSNGDASQEVTLADVESETTEEVTVVEEEQTQAPKSWWQSLFSTEATVAQDQIQSDQIQSDQVRSDQAQNEEIQSLEIQSQEIQSQEIQSNEAQKDETQNVAPELPTESPVDAPEELALSDVELETAEEVAVVEDVQTQAPKSWWQSLFSTKAAVADDDAQDDNAQDDNAQDEGAQNAEPPVDAPQELALADVEAETTEQAVVIDEDETQAPKSWWQSLFSTKAAVADDDAQDEGTQSTEPPVDAPQELVLADVEAETTEQAVVIDEDETQAPKSWWQSLFSTKAAVADDDAQDEGTQSTEPPVDAPQELALADVESETTEQAVVIEEEQTQAPKSWWQSLFSTKAAVADEEAHDVETQDADPSVEAPQELALGNEQSTAQEPVVIIEEAQANVQKSWWKTLFSTKAAQTEDQEIENDSQQPVDDENATTEQVAVAEAVQTEAPKSWWQGLFSSNTTQTDDVQQAASEEQIPQDFVPDQEGKAEQSSEEVVLESDEYNSESTEAWWNRVFAVKDTANPEPEQPTVETEASEIIAFHDSYDDMEISPIEEAQDSRVDDQRQSDGLFFVPKTTKEASVFEEVAETDYQNDAQQDEIAVVEPDTQNQTQDLQQDLQQDLEQDVNQQGQGDDQAQQNNDPVLMHLYTEPVTWMQNHAAVVAEGSWEDVPGVSDLETNQIAIAEEPEQQIENTQPSQADSAQQQVDTEEDLIIYDTESLYEEEA